jgi:ATP-dependent exoDNAse (exonuclease V) beta subunit
MNECFLGPHGGRGSVEKFCEIQGFMSKQKGSSNISTTCEPLLADADQRRRALDPTSSFHLEAPAGSGKTFLLTARFLRLLGIVEHPQHILALTFTNKAAGEMRERVGRYLSRAGKLDAASNEPDAELLEMAAKALARHKRYEDLLLGGELLRIQTFHSFCYSLVSQAPLEAGVVPGADLLVEPDQLFFLREVIDETLQNLLNRPVEDPARLAVENRLLYLNNSWPMLVQELEDLMQRRETLGDLIHILGRKEVNEYVLQGIRELAESELTGLKSVFERCDLARMWLHFMDDLSAHKAVAGSEFPAEVPGASWESLQSWQRMAEGFLTKNGQPRKKFGPATGYYTGFAKTEWARYIQDMNEAVAERLHQARGLPLPESAPPDTDVLLDLVLILNELIGTYEERCRRQRLLDFSALEMAAIRLFDTTTPSDLQLLLDQQIHHVLIDEFQDTNYQQWNLLRRLCSGWTPGDGRTLFVVGDPKQSIYGFRKAEVQLFQEAKKGVPLDSYQTLPLIPLVLHTNFRSRSHLIEWCNDLFSRTVMADPLLEKDEVEFAEAAPSPKTLEEERGCKGANPGEDRCGAPTAGGSPLQNPALPAFPPELALFAAWPEGLSARKREAGWMAHRIRQQLEESGPEHQVGILLFARTHLPIYLEALQQGGVAVQVAEGLKLMERPEVQYLWQLCRALVLPQDHLAWASQLHSPWLTLNYGEIYAIFCEEPGAWVEKIRVFAQKDQRVADFWENLRGARQHLGHEPLADVLEAAWIELEGVKHVARRWGSRGIASCRQFLEIMREAEVHEPVQTLMRAEQLLENAYEPVDPDTALSRVSLMTVHRAKGLEFDTVYLPFLDWNPVARERTNQPPYLLERVPGRSDRHLLAVRPDRRRSDPDLLYRLLLDTHVGRRWGESKRLFYVALTRARSRLLLSGVVPFKNGGEQVVFPSKTPLNWLNEHYGLREWLSFPEVKTGQFPPGESPAPAKDRAGSEAAVSPSLETPFSQEVRWGDDAGKFQVVLEPRIPPLDAAPFEGGPAVEIHPAPFEREKPLFKILNPSSFVPEEPAEYSIDGTEESGSADDPRIRGILVHRLLEVYGREKRLPPPEGVCSYLKRQGIRGEEACKMGESALDEVRACLADPWLRRFYDLPEQDRCVEYALEGLHASRTLYVGVVDLAACMEGTWWLVDFKTSKSLSADASPDAFCRGELEKYRPQLMAYREMWAKCRQVKADAVRAAVYWTALQHWEIVE